VTEARGDLRAKVLDVGSQWAQFAGWLHASGGQVADASRLYGLALEWATEAGNADMIATALNMRGHAAWIASKVGPMVGLSRAAQRVVSISPGVRALAVQQEARGAALAGDATVTDIDRMFDEAERLVAQAMSHPDREPPWIYFFSPHYLIMQRGLAYRLAGEHIKAIELIEAGLAAVPHEVRQSDWIASYLIQLALIYAQSGDVATACKLGAEVLQIGRQTHSKRLNADIRSLHARLCRRWPSDPCGCGPGIRVALSPPIFELDDETTQALAQQYVRFSIVSGGH
jgi:tetratricopeptide (TPR) repeat protein